MSNLHEIQTTFTQSLIAGRPDDCPQRPSYNTIETLPSHLLTS